MRAEPGVGKASPLVGLISSGPNRPEPLSDSVAAEPAVGIVTGHRMPNTGTAEGPLVNSLVIRPIREGADPKSAIDEVIVRRPEMDAGFVAVSIDGNVGLGNTPALLSLGGCGSGVLCAGAGGQRVATTHNSVQPQRPIPPACQRDRTRRDAP